VPNTENLYDVSTPLSLLRDHEDTLKSGPYSLIRPDCTREEKGRSLCAMKSSTTGYVNSGLFLIIVDTNLNFFTHLPQSLCNLGNTCFMNTILQCLVHTPHLANFFLSKNYSLFSSDQKLGNSFADVIDNIYQNRCSPKMLSVSYSPDDFFKDFTDDNVAPQFGDSEQRMCITCNISLSLFFLLSKSSLDFFAR
jgi:ubiquitin C-terminal hydrolase